MKIMIGTKNIAKIDAVKEAISHWQAEIFTVNVPSGVNEQPFSDEETIKGAINRAERARETENADIGIGLEGGVHETEHGLFLCNWGALAESGKTPIIAGGARLLLPQDLASKLRDGMELGPVMEEYSSKKDVRTKEGAIGIFTNGYVNRKEMFLHITSLLIGQYEYRLQKRLNEM